LRLFHVLRILSALSVGLSVAKRVHDREPKLQDFLPGRHVLLLFSSMHFSPQILSLTMFLIQICVGH
jgi:hypothetical protein